VEYLRQTLRKMEKRLAKLDEQRAELAGAIENLRTFLKESALSGRADSDNIVRMLSTARVAHSKAVTDDPLAVSANAAGHTLTSLADKVGCSQALLSQARRGTRSIAPDLAGKIEKLTGFKATKSNWPKLRSE
jgi:hypothetical protein